VPSQAEFESTLAAARTGGEWAWTAIYREYAPSVLRYLKARGAREPEDLLAEVFVQVVRGVPGFEGGEREFRAWIFLIARNRLIDERRRAGRTPFECVPAEDLGEIVDATGTEAEALSRLSHQHVMNVLSDLTPDQRDVLFLRVLAGLTAEETARVLGKRIGAVKSLQARALSAIRKKLR
jgi:RNA polymerase sigma-70 factor (ECF subfamily)